MFDIGFLELILIGVVGLLVLGPERMPSAIRTVGLWVNKIRRTVDGLRAEIEREIGAEELRQEMKLNEITDSVEQAKQKFADDVNQLQQEAQRVQNDVQEKINLAEQTTQAVTTKK